MSDHVESMMYVGDKPWHGLGEEVKGSLTPSEAIIKAGLDWSVEKRPLHYHTSEGMKESEAFGIIRTTDESFLGSCKAHYTPLQNTEMFDFFAPFAESGEVEFHTAGSLKGGSKVFILAKLNRDPLVISKDDVVDKFLLLSNTHDASTSVKVGFTPIRVVCWNTLALAENSEQSELLRVWHSQRVKMNLEKVRETVNIANQTFEAQAEQYKELLKANVNTKDIEQYVKRVFYEKDVVVVGHGVDAIGFDSQRKQTRFKNLVKRITELFESGKGNTALGVRGTWWALYNGVTQYLSYERGRTTDSRMDSLWYGNSKRTNQSALDEALVMSK